MKKALTTIVLFTICFTCFSQIPGVYIAKEYSKEITLYKAKSFLVDEVLGASNKVIKFSIDPLAAAKSGELTSLSYHCEDLKKEGLILGFYSTTWNNAGVVYQAYRFKNLPKDKANELLNQIEGLIKEHSKYIDADDDVNNIYFHYDDMTFLIYKDFSVKLRVYWGDFDSEWEMLSFKRTKKRLLRNLE